MSPWGAGGAWSAWDQALTSLGTQTLSCQTVRLSPIHPPACGQHFTNVRKCFQAGQRALCSAHTRAHLAGPAKTLRPRRAGSIESGAQGAATALTARDSYCALPLAMATRTSTSSASSAGGSGSEGAPAAAAASTEASSIASSAAACAAAETVRPNEQFKSGEACGRKVGLQQQRGAHSSMRGNGKLAGWFLHIYQAFYRQRHLYCFRSEHDDGDANTRVERRHIHAEHAERRHTRAQTKTTLNPICGTNACMRAQTRARRSRRAHTRKGRHQSAVGFSRARMHA